MQALAHDVARPPPAENSVPGRPQPRAAVLLRAVYLLAAVPLADVVLAQAQARLEINLGPLTLAQAFHGLLLVVFLAVIAGRSFLRIAEPVYPVAIAATFFGATIVLSAIARGLGGGLSLEDVTNDLKVLYWPAAWMACMVLCRRPEDFRVILGGLAVAGTYAAASVFAVYFLGIEELSPYEGIAASAGGLNTAKGLGGILAVTGLVWIWLTYERRPWLGAAGFVICYVALALTYQRAGLVAGGAAALWLAAWRIFGAMPRQRRLGMRRGGCGDPPRTGLSCTGLSCVAVPRNWALRPVMLSLVPILIVTFVLGATDMEKRWNDLWDADKAGSGRALFWQEAAAIHQQADLPGKVVGIGYGALVDRMESRYGARIHSHSDVLDALVVYGVLGLIGWLAVYGAILRMILRRGLAWPVSAAALAVFLVMALESVLTGQMFGPHVMSFYLLAIFGVCLGLPSRQHVAQPPSAVSEQLFPSPPRAAVPHPGRSPAAGCHG